MAQRLITGTAQVINCGPRHVEMERHHPAVANHPPESNPPTFADAAQLPHGRTLTYSIRESAKAEHENEARWYRGSKDSGGSRAVSRMKFALLYLVTVEKELL